MTKSIWEAPILYYFYLQSTFCRIHKLVAWLKVSRPVAEFKEFERRFKFKPRLKYGWFHLKCFKIQAGAKFKPGFGGFKPRLNIMIIPIRYIWKLWKQFQSEASKKSAFSWFKKWRKSWQRNQSLQILGFRCIWILVQTCSLVLS